MSQCFYLTEKFIHMNEGQWNTNYIYLDENFTIHLRTKLVDLKHSQILQTYLLFKHACQSIY